MQSPGYHFLSRLGQALLLLAFAILPLETARAVGINATFSATITGSPQSAQIENSIDSAINAIDKLYANPGSVSILFTTSASIGGGESDTGMYLLPYGTYSNPASLTGYTGLLANDLLSHPGDATLATAVANLSHGNDANGSQGVATTSALLRVGLGDIAATPCLNSSGALSISNGVCNGAYDGIITLGAALDYSRPNTGSVDAIRVIEHEIDEVLGAGGPGSTLNAVANCTAHGTDCVLAQFAGPLDLYRYTCNTTTPSYSTSPGVSACLSVNGGHSDIVAFNQNSAGDFADFLSTGCPPDVQDAFTCAGQLADETATSPEYQMLLSIGWDPVPEPASLALLGLGCASVAWLRRRGVRA